VDACEEGAEPDEFWSALGGKGPVAAATEDASEASVRKAAKLLKVSDATGAVTTSEVASGTLNREVRARD